MFTFFVVLGPYNIMIVNILTVNISSKPHVLTSDRDWTLNHSLGYLKCYGET